MSATEGDKVEDHLKVGFDIFHFHNLRFVQDDHLLYNWSCPQPLLTPIECYPTLFSFDSAAVNIFLQRPVCQNHK